MLLRRHRQHVNILSTFVAFMKPAGNRFKQNTVNELRNENGVVNLIMQNYFLFNIFGITQKDIK